MTILIWLGNTLHVYRITGMGCKLDICHNLDSLVHYDIYAQCFPNLWPAFCNPIKPDASRWIVESPAEIPTERSAQVSAHRPVQCIGFCRGTFLGLSHWLQNHVPHNRLYSPITHKCHHQITVPRSNGIKWVAWVSTWAPGLDCWPSGMTVNQNHWIFPLQQFWFISYAISSYISTAQMFPLSGHGLYHSMRDIQRCLVSC